jgi:hypothetical protein
MLDNVYCLQHTRCWTTAIRIERRTVWTIKPVFKPLQHGLDRKATNISKSSSTSQDTYRLSILLQAYEVHCCVRRWTFSTATSSFLFSFFKSNFNIIFTSTFFLQGFQPKLCDNVSFHSCLLHIPPYHPPCFEYPNCASTKVLIMKSPLLD